MEYFIQQLINGLTLGVTGRLPMAMKITIEAGFLFAPWAGYSPGPGSPSGESTRMMVFHFGGIYQINPRMAATLFVEPSNSKTTYGALGEIQFSKTTILAGVQLGF